MKRKRFSEEQIIAILKEHEAGVADLCRKHGMSNASLYGWRAKYGGEDASMISEMKATQDESAASSWIGHSDLGHEALSNINMSKVGRTS